MVASRHRMTKELSVAHLILINRNKRTPRYPLWISTCIPYRSFVLLGPTGGFEPPATSRATKTLKALLFNPHQFPTHGRLSRCAPTLSDRSLGVAENA